MPWQRKKRALITEMRETPLENHNKRVREYNWLQGARIPLLLAAALFYMVWQNIWIAAILTVISVPLPWIAVVVANNAGEKPDPRRPKVYKPAVARQQAKNNKVLADGAEVLTGGPRRSYQVLDTPETRQLPPGRGPVLDAKPIDDGPIVIDHIDDSTDPEEPKNG